MKILRIVKDEKGFSLPFVIILMIILTFSGLAFLHAAFLERRAGMEERWNKKAFYLAMAGIERARQSFKITTTGGTPSWTPILNPADPNHPAGYPTDASPDALLCPDMTRGCVIPPFQTTTGNPAYVKSNGQPITAADMPFSGADDVGSYSVRAFNNGGTGDSGLTDGDGIITLRAMGSVNGRVKVIQVNVLASTRSGIFSCRGNPGDPCPDQISGNPVIDYIVDRPAVSMPTLPSLALPLNDSSNYYLSLSNYPGITQTVLLSAGDTLADNSGKNKIQVQDNTLYIVTTGDSTSKITVDVSSANNIAIVNKHGGVDIDSGHLTNAVVAAAGTVMLKGGSKTSISSPMPKPAILAGSVQQGAAPVEIWGSIFATGEINLNPIKVHGVLIGDPIQIQGASGTLFTDDGNMAYYNMIPGLTYPDELKNTTIMAQTWREVE